MQLTQKMKIKEAKKYVAQKLGISVMDLADEEVMHQVRQVLTAEQIAQMEDMRVRHRHGAF